MAKLLLVDNDERIVELLGWFLETRGHSVRSAGSFREARALLEEDPPDLLLADLELGGERGAEELPRLSEAGRLPTTLVVSGYLDGEIDALLAGIPEVVGCLAKPFDLGELERQVAAGLRARAAGPAQGQAAAQAVAGAATGSRPPSAAPSPASGGPHRSSFFGPDPGSIREAGPGPGAGPQTGPQSGPPTGPQTGPESSSRSGSEPETGPAGGRPFSGPCQPGSGIPPQGA